MFLSGFFSNKLAQIIIALLSSDFSHDVSGYFWVLALVEDLPLLLVLLLLLLVTHAEEVWVVFGLVQDVELV